MSICRDTSTFGQRFRTFSPPSIVFRKFWLTRRIVGLRLSTLEEINSISNNAPESLSQRHTDRDGSRILHSARYSHLKSQLYQPVHTPKFYGYWVCRGLSREALEPRDADVCLVHFHGGGYVAGHPSDAVPEYLLMAEVLAQHNLTTAIFSLDYTLAPNAAFPTPIDEAVAMYDWLVHDLDVEPSRIALIGESAGGHLAIALLKTLHMRASPAAEQQPGPEKPAAAFLISPWVNLYTSHPKTLGLHWEDRLLKVILDRCCSKILKGSSWDVQAQYANFASDKSATSGGCWKHILPASTWVYAGSDEMPFLYDIEAFVEIARREGATVFLEVKEGGDHAWQFTEAAAQHSKLLALPPGQTDGCLMSGYRDIALTMVDLFGKSL